MANGKASRAVAQLLLKEGIDTALACGVTPAKIQGHDLVKLLNYKGALKKRLVYMLIPFAMKKHKNLVSGMYFDLAAGKKCDMDLVSGAVAEHARAAGVKTPATNAVLAVCRRIEQGELQPCPENISRVADILKKKEIE